MTDLDPGVIVWPAVQVNGSPLPDLAVRNLVRTEVDTHLRLPGMFELHFADMTGVALDAAGVEIGAKVTVRVGSAAGTPLIEGEITAVEGYYQGLAGHSLVRGYDLCHRMQRARRTRSFDNMTDSDIAQRIAKDAGLDVGTVTSTQTVHDHLLQHNQTDWEFLAQRASEIGYEFGMADGKFYFRKASALAQSNGGDSSGDGGSVGSGLQLTMPGSLLRFEPRITAGNLTPDVEVRVWDPLKEQLSTARPAKTAADGSSAAGKANPVTVASRFSKSDDGAAGGQGSSASDDLGVPPSPTAHVVTTIPVADAEAGAAALAASVGGSFAEAEGRAVGDPGIKPGSTVTISGLPGRFPADWLITRAKHVFDLGENGYRTEFTAGGANDRSLLGLTSVGGSGGMGGASPARIPGVAIAVVDDIGDQHARVRLRLPWLSTDVTTDWAPVVQFGAGKRSGAMFLPEVGDQVLVGFEFGDPRRPYVIGGLVSEKSGYDLGGGAVQQGAGGADTSVVRRGFVSASGSRLVFHDEMGEDPKPRQSRIELGTADGKFGLSVDAVNGKLELTCLPDSAGQLTINCGQAGTVNIITGQGGSVTIDGGDSITLKAQSSVAVRSTGTVSVSGQSITLGG